MPSLRSRRRASTFAWCRSKPTCTLVGPAKSVPSTVSVSPVGTDWEKSESLEATSTCSRSCRGGGAPPVSMGRGTSQVARRPAKVLSESSPDRPAPGLAHAPSAMQGIHAQAFSVRELQGAMVLARAHRVAVVGLEGQHALRGGTGDVRDPDAERLPAPGQLALALLDLQE